MTTQHKKIARLLNALEARELEKNGKISKEYEQLQNLISQARQEKQSLTERHLDKIDDWAIETQVNYERRLLVLEQYILEKNLELMGLAAKYETQKQATTRAVGRKAAFKKITK